ncbi:MAG: hypothetical protein WA919_27150 [Coleofasciculaceae cyanobacterium]
MNSLGALIFIHPGYSHFGKNKDEVGEVGERMNAEFRMKNVEMGGQGGRKNGGIQNSECTKVGEMGEMGEIDNFKF